METFVQGGNIDGIKLLLEYDNNLINSSPDLLREAVHCGWVEVTKLLLSYGALINFNGENICTCYLYGCDHIEMDGSDEDLTYQIILNAGYIPKSTARDPEIVKNIDQILGKYLSQSQSQIE